MELKDRDKYYYMFMDICHNHHNINKVKPFPCPSCNGSTSSSLWDGYIKFNCKKCNFDICDFEFRKVILIDNVSYLIEWLMNDRYGEPQEIYYFCESSGNQIDFFIPYDVDANMFKKILLLK